MMIDIDELANRIHADVFDVAKTGIPLGVFPNVFQKIAFELVNYENFNLEYTVAIMLSAFATAIGNTYHVRIKGKWVTACFLYMILVGRPGLGKTPPLGFLYFPIRDYDQRLLEQARKEYEARRLDEELVLAGLRNWGASPGRDPARLARYARALGVFDRVKAQVEVLL